MREFFKGWRRKIGVLTLAMSVALMGLWIRSLHTFDEIFVAIGNAKYFVSSAQGGFGLLIDEPSGRSPSFAIFSEPIPPPCPQIDLDFVEVPKQGLESLGFYFGGDEDRNATFVMPYWSIIWPLVISAAYLILWKPWKRC